MKDYYTKDEINYLNKMVECILQAEKLRKNRNEWF